MRLIKGLGTNPGVVAYSIAIGTRINKLITGRSEQSNAWCACRSPAPREFPIALLEMLFDLALLSGSQRSRHRYCRVSLILSFSMCKRSSKAVAFLLKLPFAEGER